MRKASKKPLENRSPMSEWKIQQRASDLKALEVAKSQEKPIKYLLK